MNDTNTKEAPTTDLGVEQCAGYKTLLAAVERDERESPGFHNYREKLAWVLARAAHYSEKTGIPASDILNAWEKQRSYWYMNFYQDCKQPEIKGDRVRVFDTVEALLASIGDTGFRCPKCNQVSKSPYECSVAPCDWKVYGLFGHMGKGVFAFVKEQVAGENLFMPVAWEAAA
jgi:hypothetical protein